MLEFRCKFCDEELTVEDEEAGEQVECPRCTAIQNAPEEECDESGEEEDFRIKKHGGNPMLIPLIAWVALVLVIALAYNIRENFFFTSMVFSAVVTSILITPAFVIYHIVGHARYRR